MESDKALEEMRASEILPPLQQHRVSESASHSLDGRRGILQEFDYERLIMMMAKIRRQSASLRLSG